MKSSKETKKVPEIFKNDKPILPPKPAGLIKPAIAPKPKILPKPPYPNNVPPVRTVNASLFTTNAHLFSQQNKRKYGNSNALKQKSRLLVQKCIRNIEPENLSSCSSSSSSESSLTKGDLNCEEYSESSINKLKINKEKNSSQLLSTNLKKYLRVNGFPDTNIDASSSLMEKALENCNRNDLVARTSHGSSSLSESDSCEYLPSSMYERCSPDPQNNSSLESDPDTSIPYSLESNNNNLLSSAKELSKTCELDPSSETYQKSRARKAFLVAQEIMTSEKTFVSILKLLNLELRQYLEDKNCIFRNRISKSSDEEDNNGTRLPKEQNNDTDSKIPEKDLNLLLKFLPNLQKLNEEILNDFQTRISNWENHPKIADVIVEKGPYLKLYCHYIQDLESQTNLLKQLTIKHSYFGECIREFEQSETCGKIQISFHMLTPMQRITKYRDLMKQYLKYLNLDSLDYSDAVSALEIVKDVAEHANESIRNLENSARLLNLQERLNGITNGGDTSSPSLSSGNHVLVEPGRSLVKEGELMKLCRRGVRVVYLILLSDALLYTTEDANSGKNGPLKLRYTLPLEGMRVDLPKSEDFQNEFTVISTSRSFTVRTRSTYERNCWIDSLKTAIDANAIRRWSFQNAKTADYESISPHILGKQAPAWIPDNRVTMCQLCTKEFSFTFRRHHCRACGKVVCRYCSANKAPLEYMKNEPERVCDTCFDELQKNLNQMEDLVPPEDTFKRESVRSLKTRFRKGMRDNTKKSRSRKPHRLMEVCGGDFSSQICGYLRHFNGKMWRLSWFVLKDKVLYEYRAPEDVCALSSLPVLGYSVTEDFENTSIFDGMDPANAFQLLHPNQSPLVFCTESYDLANKWRAAMVESVIL